jgi:MFS family permease
MIDELGWTRADYTLTRTIGQLVMACVGVFVGARVDQFGGRPIMLMGNTVLVVALCLHSLVNTLWQWWVLNGVVLTVGCAMIGNLVVNVTLAKWFVVNRGKAVAFAAMGVSFGGVALTPLATWLVDAIGWRYAWIWLGVVAAVLLYPVALLMRRAPEDYGLHPDGHSDADMAGGAGQRADLENANAYTRREALRTFSFYALVVAFGFFSINIIVLLLQTVPYLTDYGFTRNEAAMALFVASVPAMISKPILSRLRHWAQQKLRRRWSCAPSACAGPPRGLRG